MQNFACILQSKPEYARYTNVCQRMQEYPRECRVSNGMPKYYLKLEYAIVCQNMQKYNRVCQSMSVYARVCQSNGRMQCMPEYTRVIQSMQEYAQICQRMLEYARVRQSRQNYVKKC